MATEVLDQNCSATSFKPGNTGMDMSDAGDEDVLRKCAHGPCICMVYPEQEYCSRHCSNAANAEKPEVSCDCGHLNCALRGTSQEQTWAVVSRRQTGGVVNLDSGHA